MSFGFRYSEKMKNTPKFIKKKFKNINQKEIYKDQPSKIAELVYKKQKKFIVQELAKLNQPFLNLNHIKAYILLVGDS